jgi:leucyl-tRNA synthetase
LSIVEVVRVDEGEKTRVVVGGEEKVVEGLPQPAEGAVPGVPTSHFENAEV